MMGLASGELSQNGGLMGIEWDLMVITRPGERLHFANWKDPPL